MQPVPIRLLPDTATFDADETFVGGVPLQALAETFETPLFVYDEATLRARCREAASVFDFGVAFASKSFLCGAMARLAYSEGLCIDVATGGELDLVLRSGVPADHIILHGNNKSWEELRRAISVGVHRIVVDNFDEIDRLTSLVTPGANVHVLVRVTPGVEAHTHEFVRTGHEDTKFGFAIATGAARDAIERLRSVEGIVLHGIHAHIGSQIFGFAGFVEAIGILADFMANDRFDELCVGGGLGVAYTQDEYAPSITEWGTQLRQAIKSCGLGDLRVLAEPGRAIVAQAAVTLYTVGAIKEVTQRTYMAVDGGMSDNIRPALYGAEYLAIIANRLPLGPTQNSRIVGKHCESGDILIREIQISSDIQPGDLIAIPATGAYGRSMASNYNHLTKPAVVAVRDGAARIITKRESIADILAMDI